MTKNREAGAKRTIEDEYAERRSYGWRAKGLTKNQCEPPENVIDFIRSGGMRQIEYVAGVEAAEEAKQYERQYWLPRLEEWLVKWESEHPKGDMVGELYGGQFREEITRLRRKVKIYKGSEEQRAAVRERVRKRRERERAWWCSPGSIHYRPPEEPASQ